MTKLEQLHLFLKFHFAPESDAKLEVWGSCCTEPYTEVEVEKVITDLMDGSIGFTDYEISLLRIVASPPSFANNDVELAMKLADAVAGQEGDTEAIHTTADEFLVSLIEQLGHPSVAQAYRAVPKW